MTPAEIYFERVILTYLVGDIEHLLSNREARSGILLGPVLNGIDVIGGVLFGFETGSKCRCVRVMTEHMRLRSPEATYIYSSLRCGLVHQGTAKYGLWFFAIYDDLNRFSIIYKDEEDWLYLDTVALAERFVAAAKRIWAERRAEILHVPPCELAGHDDVVKLDVPDIKKLLWDYAEEHASVRKWRIGDLIRREPTSMSAYTPGDVLNPRLRVLPSTEVARGTIDYVKENG
jgi:hypothetical protein